VGGKAAWEGIFGVVTSAAESSSPADASTGSATASGQPRLHLSQLIVGVVQIVPGRRRDLEEDFVEFLDTLGRVCLAG